MSLKLYYEPHEDKYFTSTNPFTITVDGRIGGKLDKCVYIRNDDSTKWYNNIQLSVVDSETPDRTDGSLTGWHWKLLEKDIPPLIEEWDSVVAGSALTLSTDIGSSSLYNITAYVPVWVRVEIPRGQSVQNITNIVLRIDAQENVVGS